MQLFLDEARRRVDAATAAAGRGEAAEVALIAHSLKGSSANLAAHSMAALCSDLERECGAGDIAGAQLTLIRLDAEFQLAEA